MNSVCFLRCLKACYKQCGKTNPPFFSFYDTVDEEPETVLFCLPLGLILCMPLQVCHFYWQNKKKGSIFSVFCMSDTAHMSDECSVHHSSLKHPASIRLLYSPAIWVGYYSPWPRNPDFTFLAHIKHSVSAAHVCSCTYYAAGKLLFSQSITFPLFFGMNTVYNHSPKGHRDTMTADVLKEKFHHFCLEFIVYLVLIELIHWSSMVQHSLDFLLLSA